VGDVINMVARARLIREAREAREKRRAEQAVAERPAHPGGIDDMEF
jgi:hypothetical protein